MNSIFSELTTRFPSSNDLFEYLKSEDGGKLYIDERQKTDTNPFVLIRYRKGDSDFSKPHVKYFRSIVWNAETNKPVCITPPKSVEGESIPTSSIADFNITTFVDGVLIGLYYNGTEWNIHTRSTLGAKCRYYSTEKTFAQMFEEAKEAYGTEVFNSKLNTSYCYSFILQHPQNRIVCSVSAPKLTLVASYKINEENTVETNDISTIDLNKPNSFTFEDWNALSMKLMEWDSLYKHNFQGFVITNKATNERFKIRTNKYKQVRLVRQNTPRRDFVWLSEWAKGELRQYLRIYPEETEQANAIVNKYKSFCSEVFRIYTEVFKAHTMERHEIPKKYRMFIYSLHKHYYEVVKPTGFGLSWNATREFLNTRDVPMMLYGINFDNRSRPSNNIIIEPSHIANPTENVIVHDGEGATTETVVETKTDD
jgi:hypothetical protein